MMQPQAKDTFINTRELQDTHVSVADRVKMKLNFALKKHKLY